MKLTKTDAQTNYHLVLKHVVTGLSYVELRKIIKQKWIDDVRDFGFIEKVGEIEGPARNTIIFGLTETGVKYYEALESNCLFDSSKWQGNFEDYFSFYTRGGDLQELYPVALCALRDKTHLIDTLAVATHCLSTDNGYLHVLGNLYLSYGASVLSWMDSNHNTQAKWFDADGNEDEKVVTIRLSRVGADALSRVVAKLESKELTSGYRSWKAGEGFSMELGIIALASLLDTLV